MKAFMLSCLGIFIVFTAFAQMTIKGQVIDNQSKKGIPYALITWQQQAMGIYTKADGTFEIVPNSTDSIFKISALGYKDTTLNFILKETLIIPIHRQTYNFKEVIVKDQTYKLIKDEMPKKGVSSFRSCDEVHRFIMGTSFPTIGKGFFRSVQFKVSSKSDEQHQLRLRIFEMDKAGQPSHDILNEHIPIPQKKGWITVDLESYNIPIPENGYLMAIEWIDTGILNKEDCKAVKVKATKINQSSSYQAWKRSFINNKWSKYELLEKDNTQYMLYFKVSMDLNELYFRN